MSAAVSSALPPNVFATFDGSTTAAAPTQQIPIHLTKGGFNFSLLKSLTLGFDLIAPPGSALDPAPVSIRNASGQPVRPLDADTDPGAGVQRATLYRLGAGDYSLGVSGRRGTIGAYQLQAYLVGDANGNRGVETSDGLILLNLLRQHGYSAAADADLDGRITGYDVAQQILNLGATTTINPLFLTAGLVPAPTGVLANGTPVTNHTSEAVAGSTNPSATVSLDLNGNKFTSGSAVAGSAGTYSIPVTLHPDLNVLTVQATDAFGQHRTASTRVILDTAPPAINAALADDTGISHSDGITSDPAVSGSVSDNYGIRNLRAGLDAMAPGSFADVSALAQPNGAFVFSRGIVDQIYGGHLPDGPHVLHLQATDIAGNASAVYDIPFTLDTTPPAPPSFQLDSSTDSLPLGDNTTTFRAVLLDGQTDPNTAVSLGATNKTSAGGGTFQFPGVLLTDGANALTVTATDIAGNTSSAMRTITHVSSRSSGQVVLDWDQAILNAIQLDDSDPEYASRAMGIMSAAVYDAINSIDGSSSFLFVHSAAPAGASDIAAAAQAAHDALNYLYPAQQATFDGLLATELGAMPDGMAKTGGIAVGQSVAGAIIAIRSHDGSTNFVDYTPGSAPGQWQPTYPAYAPALRPNWASLQPFLMTSDSQFRPAGPTTLAGAQYAAEVNQVKDLGSATSADRTADQTQVARFWNDAGGSYTPPGHWDQIAGQFASQQNLNLGDASRLFAELNVGMADAGVAVWDAKYAYNFWRPITAIRQANSAGNSAVTQDAGWTPLLNTPPFPEYVSGHSTFSSTAATILDDFFGSGVSFTISSVGLPGVTRSFANFDAAAQEAAMSRIYGGIHFNTSVQDGLTMGKQLGQFVLQKFQQTADTAPPLVTVMSPMPNQAGNVDPTISGQITDNLSGVASLLYALDSGSFTAATFDSSGHFSITTTLPLGGSADGPHVLHLKATDNAGNATGDVQFSLTLDTKLPTIALTSPADAGSISAGDVVSGSVSGTGSAVVALSYAFDGGTSMPISFSAADGSFSQALDLSHLSAGSHTLVVSATDAAGNSTSTTLHLTLASMIPLTITDFTPTSGASDVGATFRPKITFSRPINPATLTAADFFATDTTNTKLPATIVPSDDGTYAWLFFTNPMPGASMIHVTVDGFGIAAPDGTKLDAAGNGSAGSKLTWGFSTVSLAALPNTSLTGIVADPGPDLQPGSLDDVSPGPDGVLGTSDDVYKLPIAGVTVSIAGTSISTVTGTDGRFTLPSIPSGDVKLLVEGPSATNAPAGFYFPEMVMDLNILPGQANAVMSAMQRTGTGNSQPGAPTSAALGVYLPRLHSSILQTVSPTGMTEIGVDATSAPQLTDQQRQELSIDVPGGTAIGMNGSKMSNVQIGISTVPPQLVMDMLPAGLMQHTFDITIQAPGVATFSQQVAMTFPNVFNSAPGTKLNFLSFDHTTGRLTIEGTATVSTDGLSVVTDPGDGITHPGWHGLTPPGTDGEDDPSPGPDPNNPCDDPHYDRLLDENYSSDVEEKLSELEKDNDFALQPLGTHALGGSGVLGTGLPYANEDDYEVTIPSGMLPTGFDPSAFLATWPQDMNAVPQSGTLARGIFGTVNTFDTSSGPVKPGDVIGIDIAGYSTFLPIEAYVMMTDQQANYFRFSTLTNIVPGTAGTVGIVHPVSGSREFGFSQSSDGSITFYTRGLDTPTSWAAETAGVFAQRQGWSNFMVGLAQRFGYSRAQAEQLLHAETHAVEDEPPCHSAPGDSLAEDAVGAEALVADPITAVQGVEPLPQYWRVTLLSEGAGLKETDLTGRINAGQPIDLFLPANTNYTLYIYDPNTNKWGVSSGLTAAEGRSTLAPVYVDLDAGPTGADGLPIAAQSILGLSQSAQSTSGDGISDGAKVALGADPFANLATPTGNIASVSLQGTSKAVDFVGSATSSTHQTAFIATGSYGIAITDSSRGQNPILLSQLRLAAGDATAISVDPDLNIAAVADNSGGLVLVDVSDPTEPKVVQDIKINTSQVVAADGIAYAAVGGSLQAYDITAGDLLQTLSVGFGTITGLAREGTKIYTVDTADTLHVVDISSGQMVERGALSMPAGGGKLFVGGGIAYVSAVPTGSFNPNQGGFATADVSNPDHPVLLSGPTANTIAGLALHANGSGLAVSVGSFVGFGGVLDVANVSDPTQTNQFVTRYTLPAAPFDTTIAGGIAYVADGTGGLQVVNYEAFDNKGVPPTVSIDTSNLDTDPITPGIQVVQGSTIDINANVSDDVQVRNVELLVNGQVVQNAVSFPFNLSAVALGADPTATTMTIQVEAFDTGGNAAMSDVITLDLVPDTTPPTISNITPADGAIGFAGRKAVQITFSEPIDAASVTAADFQLISAGPDGVFGTADDQTVPVTLNLENGGRLVDMTFATLDAGSYQIQLNGAAITDRAGNPLSAGVVTSGFTLAARPTLDTLFDLRGTPVSGPIVLKGTALTLGIDSDGSFITNDVSTGIVFGGLEFVTWGTPLATFAAGFNGQSFENGAPATGSAIPVTIEDLSSGSFHGVRVVGTIGGVLQIERVVVFNDGDQFATIATRVTNLSSATLNNVATLENLDPDQGIPIGQGFSTSNDVVLGGQFVRASVFNSTYPGGLTIGLGSADPRAVTGAQGFEVFNPFDIINNPQDPNGAFNDIAINLAVNLGTLAPGQSASTSCVLVLGASTADADATYTSSSAITAGGT